MRNASSWLGFSRMAVAVAATAALSGCGSAPGPATTAALAAAPTPGCQDMPWSGYSGLTNLPAPDGLAIARTPGGVLVSNRTATTWSVRGEWWTQQPCFGWTEARERSAALGVAPGASTEVPAADPEIEGALASRIGVEFWNRACGQSCEGPPDGFAWIPAGSPQPTAPPATASPAPSSPPAAIPVHVRFAGPRLGCVNNFPYSCAATLSLVPTGTVVPEEWRPSAADPSWLPGDPRPAGAEPAVAPGPQRLVVSLLGSYDTPSYAPDGSRAFDLLSRCWADVDVPTAGALDVLITFSGGDPASFRVSCSVVARAA